MEETAESSNETSETSEETAESSEETAESSEETAESSEETAETAKHGPERAAVRSPAVHIGRVTFEHLAVGGELRSVRAEQAAQVADDNQPEYEQTH